MVEFKWIKMSLFLIVLLQFGAVTGHDSSVIVRDGDSTTLPCRNVIKSQDKCDRTTWMYSRVEMSPLVELIKLGQIGANAKAKSDRLSVTADCSLVIKNITYEDVGRYVCRQFDRSGRQQRPDSRVHMSVVIINEQKAADDKVTLSCTMLTYGQCQGSVEWQFEDSKDDFTDVEMFGVPCRVSVTFTASSRAQKSKYSELFKCNATERNSGETVLCNLGPQSSCEKEGSTTGEDETTFDGPTKLPACADCSALIYTMLVMRVVEFVLITVVTVLITVVAVRHFRARAGNQRPPDDHTVSYSVRSGTARRSGPAASQMHHGEDDNVTVNYENLREN